ncbi:MAG: hypothetical protein HUU15_11530 [Candidatus Brocadiae bacterium]|nr:hypothetical protein [Candidatus Brocadiia bacterium]
MPSLAAPGFDLDLTLRSGQFFRFRPDGDGFLLVDSGRVLRLRPQGDRIEYRGGTAAHVRRLLGLDADHGAALAALRRDPLLAAVLPRYAGMRIMTQDPWVCLVSFVCSSMSNMKRIQGNVEGIARAFGPALEDGIHDFPGPAALPAGALAPIRLGWRERFVAGLFARVDPARLHALAARPFEEARAALMELPGVGPKVAECVMAFSLGFGEACPVDVWIRRVGRRLWFRNRRVPDRRIADRFRATFGRHAALAQQIWFQAVRDGVPVGQAPR